MLKAFYSAPDYKSLRDAEQRKRFAFCDLLACVRIYVSVLAYSFRFLSLDKSFFFTIACEK